MTAPIYLLASIVAVVQLINGAVWFPAAVFSFVFVYLCGWVLIARETQQRKEPPNRLVQASRGDRS